MTALLDAYAAQPLWAWLALAAILLAVEVATGTGWLLWAAAAAAMTALVAAALRPGLPVEVGTFAVLTLASTLAAQRFLPPDRPHDGPDINDQAHRLVGLTGEVTAAFVGGEGRVLVDGAEWLASADGEVALERGQRVRVTGLLGGSRLRVST